MKNLIMSVTFTLAAMQAHTVWAQPLTITATGTGRNLEIAQENSWVAAHFACNRKGFWADLDTIQRTSTDVSSYSLAGSSRKIKQYNVNVSATCGVDYMRSPSEQVDQ